MLHGNAEVERLFGSLGDIMTKKRQLLDQQSAKALLFCKSHVAANGYNCHTFPMSPVLLQMATNARAAYHARIHKEKEAEDKRKVEEALQRHAALLEKIPFYLKFQDRVKWICGIWPSQFLEKHGLKYNWI